MNRRELAKNGFLALCGALLGKLLKKQEQETINITTSTGSNGTWKRTSWTCLAGNAEDGYSLSDGTEIEHG